MSSRSVPSPSGPAQLLAAALSGRDLDGIERLALGMWLERVGESLAALVTPRRAA